MNSLNTKRLLTSLALSALLVSNSFAASSINYQIMGLGSEAEALGFQDKVPIPTTNLLNVDLDYNLSNPNNLILNINVNGNGQIEWHSYNVGIMSTVNYLGTGAVVETVSGGTRSFINGLINAANVNIFHTNPNGVIIGSNANITAQNLLMSTLEVEDFSKFNSQNEVDLILSQAGKYSGIIVREGADIQVTNRIDFVGQGFRNENAVDFPNTQYITSDGITFELNADKSIASIAENSAPTEADYQANAPFVDIDEDGTKEYIALLGIDFVKLNQTIVPPPPPAPEPDQAVSPDFFELNRDFSLRTITPTSQASSFGQTEQVNLANLQMEVSPIGATELADATESDALVPEEYGRIALNDSNERGLPAGLTPIAAAAQIDNTGSEYLGEYDMIIQEAIIE